EDAAAVGRQLYAAELLAGDSFNAVVPGQALVDEAEVGIDQVQDATVFPHDGLEEQLGLAEHGRAQLVVETGEDPGIWGDQGEIAGREPLAGEAVYERRRLRVIEHPPHLRLQVGPQLALLGEAEQLVVRHAAPEEVRQPARQLVLVDRIRRLRLRA